MEKLLFYLRVVLPNAVFFAVYLIFLVNKDLFSAAPDNITWVGYTFSVLVLVTISIYLNRFHQQNISFTSGEACREELKKEFARKGYYLKAEAENTLVFNKRFVQSSFLTPPVFLAFSENSAKLSGPKVKVDDIIEKFEETESENIRLAAPSLAA